MGIEKVREEVLAKARRQAAQIIAEGKKEEEAITRAAEEKAEAMRKTSLPQAEKEMAEAKARELSAAELEASKMILDAKKRLIEEAFNAAMEQVARLTASQRKEHIRKLLERARAQIEIGKVLCNEKDIKSIDNLKALPARISGGIIADNKDGTIRIDCSYEALMEKAKEKVMKDVAKALFKEE